MTKAQLAQAFGGGQAPKFRSVSVHGDQATVTYTATDSGKTFTETDGLVKEDGSLEGGPDDQPPQRRLSAARPARTSAVTAAVTAANSRLSAG